VKNLNNGGVFIAQFGATVAVFGCITKIQNYTLGTAILLVLDMFQLGKL
jgi:hypothetical protein